MSELKLKPCPCCESDEVIHFKKTRNRGYVTCIACGMRTRGCGNYENKDDLKWRERATILWNTRKPMANIVEKLEEELLTSQSAHVGAASGMCGFLASGYSGEISAYKKPST